MAISFSRHTDIILGRTLVVMMISVRERLLRKMYMGVCSLVSSTTAKKTIKLPMSTRM
uniref:Uncharacterized protein n=1 Tax=Anguilla anguilla TaxID=7936 RepID=A0A0E9S2H3_ANGAN